MYSSSRLNKWPTNCGSKCLNTDFTNVSTCKNSYPIKHIPVKTISIVRHKYLGLHFQNVVKESSQQSLLQETNKFTLQKYVNMLHLLLRCKKFSGWIVWPHLARWKQWTVPQTRGVGCTQSPLRPVTQSHGYRSRNPEKASHSYSKSSIINDWPVDNWIMEINFHK